MPQSQIYCLITMENSSSKANQSSFPLFALIEFSLFYRFFRWVNGIRSFFLRFWSLIRSQCVFKNESQNFKFLNQKDSTEEKKSEDELYIEDVKTVMKSLGLVCHPETEELQEKFDFHELSGLFEEKEPSLDEVKGAFDVFDQNRDGFIDAAELQRILCILGLNEGFNLETCKQMIKSFDENKDGRIDFHEFVRLVENSFR